MSRTSVCIAGQVDRDRRVGVGRQALLRAPALLAQPGDARERGRVVRVERDAGGPDRGHDVGEDRFVEVDPAESLHALRTTELVEPVLGLAQDRGVERAAAEVVDGDHLARRDALLEGVVEGGGLRLGDELTWPMSDWRTAWRSRSILYSP